MPNQYKENQVEQIKDMLDRCTIAVAASYVGMSAAAMDDLRSKMRDNQIEFRVVKNTLTIRAANDLGKPAMDKILIGPTALAFGYGDVISVAKGLNDHINAARIPLVINGAVMGSDMLTGEQVTHMATLPSRDELIARLIGQMQAPIGSFVNVMAGSLRGLMTVLTRRVDQIGADQS